MISMLADLYCERYEVELLPTEHIYLVNGQRKKSPTVILREMGLTKDYSNIDPEVLQHAAERGSATHLAILYDAHGVLDETTLDDEVRPYFDAYKLFKKEHSWSPWIDYCELPLYHEELDYCVTQDAVGLLDGRASLIDWKTSYSHDPVVEIQTAAQILAWNAASTEPITKRYSLQLKKNGRYVLRDHSEVNPSIWIHCMGLWRWLERGRRA